MTKLWRYILLSFLLFSLCCSGNINESYQNTGGGTEITGYMVTSDTKPAINAHVYLFNETSDTIRTTTNDSGKYTFTQKIPDGFYTLWGKKDSLECYISRIWYQPPYEVRIDTLKYPGWIFATVYLENCDKREGVEVYIPGTSFSGKSDSLGNVTLWYVPPGDYRVVFQYRGFISTSQKAHVVSNRTDTLPLLTLLRDESAEPVTPAKLNAYVDSIFGLVHLVWDKSVENNFNYYEIRVIDKINRGIPHDLIRDTLYNESFVDTVYSWNAVDSTRLKYRAYQIRQVTTNYNTSKWSDICSLYIERPSVPPAPVCTLVTVSDLTTIDIKVSLPEMWWIDSLIFNRSVFDCVTTLSISFADYLKNGFKDFINSIPVVSDSIIPINYTFFARSTDGLLSSSSNTHTTKLPNPYTHYSIPKPNAPTGLPHQGEAGSYCVSILPVTSTVQNDTTEYRIVWKNEHDSTAAYTSWYVMPSIEIPLEKEGHYSVQCQARSRRLYNLQSQISDEAIITINKIHRIPKPSTPVGKSLVMHSAPYSYQLDTLSLCSFDHPLSIRFFISYEGNKCSDSTDWKPLTDNATTIIWSKPGIGYLRAQARCTVVPEILSPWSDALVVTIE